MIFINPWWAFYDSDDIPDLTPRDNEEMVGCFAVLCGFIVSTIIYILLFYLCFTLTKGVLMIILILINSAVIYPIIIIYLVDLSSKIADRITTDNKKK